MLDPASRPPPDSPSGSAEAEPGCVSAGFYTARDAKNERHFTLWMLGAALAYVGATAAFRWRGSIPETLPWLLAAAAWLLAIQTVWSYLTFLRAADELLRKIQVEALALGFGSGAVVSLLYPLLERLGAPHFGAEAAGVVMMLSWSAGTLLGTRRYSGRSVP
jgi:hypothetical protein